MGNADNTNTSQTNQNDSVGDKVTQELAKVQQQMEEMNRSFAAQTQALTSAIQSKKQEETVITSDDVYDPAVLTKKVLQQADALTNARIKSEREKDMMIYNLAQDYPEIQSNAEVRKAVIEAQSQIPEALRDTAAGYEMAVLKAVSKQGLVPKSKRKQQSEEDFSFGGGSNGETRTPKSRKKVTSNMLALAELLGRPVNDENFQKRLEDAANRDTYTKYR